jgi:predicted ester cyclase
MLRFLDVFRRKKKKKKHKEIVQTGRKVETNPSTFVDGKQEIVQTGTRVETNLSTFVDSKQERTQQVAKHSSSSSEEDESSHGDASSSSSSSSSRDLSLVGSDIQMTNAAIRELVKRYFVKIWNRGETEDIPNVCSRKFHFNGSPQPLTHEEFKNVVENTHDGLDLFHAEMHSIVVEGNKAFCRMLFTGIHNDEYLGHRPTGKSISWMGATEFTIKNGRIDATWELVDLQSLRKQLQG